jgi:uncharacterized membrane protein YfcA
VKSPILLFVALSLISAVLGFRFLSGIPATIFQALSALLFILAGLVLFRRRRVQKPRKSSFAASFRSQIPARAVPTVPDPPPISE